MSTIEVRWAFWCTFPQRGFVQYVRTGLPVTYKNRPGRRERERCDPLGIAKVVRVRVWPAGTRADDNGLPSYEVLS